MLIVGAAATPKLCGDANAAARDADGEFCGGSRLIGCNPVATDGEMERMSRLLDPWHSRVPGRDTRGLYFHKSFGGRRGFRWETQLD